MAMDRVTLQSAPLIKYLHILTHQLKLRCRFKYFSLICWYAGHTDRKCFSVPHSPLHYRKNSWYCENCRTFCNVYDHLFQIGILQTRFIFFTSNKFNFFLRRIFNCSCVFIPFQVFPSEGERKNII